MNQNNQGRFYGTFYGTITDRRIVIPKIFVKELKFYGDSKNIIITRGGEECLILFPESVFYKYCDILENGNSIDIAKLRVWEHFSTGSKKLEANGRVRIPQELLSSLSMDKDIKFIGQKDHITIWAKDKSDQIEQDLLAALANSTMKSSVRI